MAHSTDADEVQSTLIQMATAGTQGWAHNSDSLTLMHPRAPSTPVADIKRIEMRWHSQQELHLHDIAQQCRDSARVHRRWGRWCKIAFSVLSLPCVVLPLAVGALENHAARSHMRWFIPASMISVGVLNGINTLLDLGRRSESHFSSEQLYATLRSEIQLVLVKPRRVRVAADVFLERVNQRFCSINDKAPPVLTRNSVTPGSAPDPIRVGITRRSS